MELCTSHQVCGSLYLWSFTVQLTWVGSAQVKAFILNRSSGAQHSTWEEAVRGVIHIGSNLGKFIGIQSESTWGGLHLHWVLLQHLGVLYMGSKLGKFTGIQSESIWGAFHLHWVLFLQSGFSEMLLNGFYHRLLWMFSRHLLGTSLFCVISYW